jgi:hypothetical protein
MFSIYLQMLARTLGIKKTRPARRRTGRHTLFVECLESRNLPAPLTWAAGVNLPAPAGGIVAQQEAGGVLALGGPTTTSDNVSVTNPTWQAKITSTVQPLDFARFSPGVGTLPDGYFIVFGGTQNGFATSAVTQYDPNTVSVPDGVTNQTHSLRSMNNPRALLGWAIDTNHISYAIGGVDNNGTPLATVEAYNPTTNTWSYVASLPQTLYSESAVSDGAGHIYTFGGVGANGTIINNVYRYTIATNTWDQVAPLQVGVRDSAAVLASNGLIYVLGGTTSAGATATVESYNISTNTWNVETSLPQAMSSEAATVDSLGRIEVLGGYDASGNPLATTYISQQFSQPDLAPTITSTAPTTAFTAGYTYQVLSTGSPQPSFSLTAAPAGMTISSNGLITWFPSQAQIGGGPYNVTVQASNYAGQTTQTYNIVTVKQSQPTVPTGVYESSSTVDSFTLTWNPSTGPIGIDHYNIYHYYATGHSGRGSNITYHHDLVGTSTTNSFTLGGLASGSSAWYTVTAVDPNGLSSGYSAIYTGTTLPDNVPPVLTVPANQTVTASSPSGVTDPGAFTATATDPGPGIDNITIVYEVGPNQVSSTYVFPVGTTTVTAVARDMYGNYTDGTFTVQVDLFPAIPSVTMSAGPFTYNGNSQAITATAVGTDGVTPIAGSFAFTYNGSATPPTDAGSYAVTATFTSADPSYASTTVTTTETINPATPTITVSSGPFNYDGVTQESASATAVGVDGVTPVSGAFTYTYFDSTGAQLATPPIGPGLYTVAATFTSNDPNYTSSTVNANLIINSPGTLVPTLSLVDGSTTYDGNAHSDTVSEVGADGVTAVNGSFIITYNGSTTAPTAAGTYAVVANFISSDLNYTNASITSTLTISQATPTIAIASSYPFYYDTFAQAQYVTEVGVDGVTPVDGTLTVLYNGSSTLPVNAGTYDVSVTFTSNDPNYVSTTADGSMTIQQAGVNLYYSLNGGAYYYYYNGTPQGVTGTATGYFNDPVNGTFSYAYFDSTGAQLPGTPTSAGYYTFTEYFTSNDPNYASGSFSYNFSIYAVTPTVTVTGGTFTYNGQGQAATASAVGIDGVTAVPGSASFTYNGSSSTPVLPGTYAVVGTFTPTDPNYTSATGTATLVINKATPVFSNLGSPAVNFGASTVTVSGHIAAGSAAPGGDDVAVTLNGVTQAASVSGSGSFSTTFNIQGLSTGTYAINYAYLGDATRFNAATSGSGTLTVQAAPSILTAPVSQTVTAGSSVTFSASASGFPTPTVQWQQSTNGTNWSSISGATSTTYTIGATTASQNGYRYRAVFTNSVGSATTAVATLSVQFAPTVTSSPHSQTVNAGQTATFTAAGTGNPAPTVQWQVSTDAGNTFSNIAGATGTTLTLSGTTAGQNGNIYQAVFTNSVGSVTTTRATLTVRYAPVVSSSPTSQTVNAGQSVTFTAAGTGNPGASIQWQVSTNGGSTFSNISGAHSTTLTLTNTTASQNGYEYRAVFTNSLGSATTSAATLTVLFPPTVTVNPTSQSVTAGNSATFTAAATGNSTPTVQWQVSTDGGHTFVNIAGATATSLTISGTTASMNGDEYRALFTNSLGSVLTTAAILTVM